MTKREIRRRLKEYFGNISNQVLFGKADGKMLVDIEYEDFHSEPRVKAEIRQIVGKDVTICIKRNCSAALMRNINYLLYGNIDDLRFHLMETLEMP